MKKNKMVMMATALGAIGATYLLTNKKTRNKAKRIANNAMDEVEKKYNEYM